MNRKIWFVVTFFFFLVTGYVVVQYFIMDGFQTGLVKAKLMFGSKLSAFWYMMLFIHIIRRRFWTISILLCYGRIGSEARFWFVICILANIGISSVT